MSIPSAQTRALWRAQSRDAMCSALDEYCPLDEFNALLNAVDTLEAASLAAIKYDEAINSCANDPAQMASFCSAQGENLDTLYLDWITKSRQALEKEP